MSILTYLSPARISRFMTAVRHEGWRAAIAKARAYVAMHRAGRGRSALSHQPHQPAPEERYLNEVWREMAQKDAFHIGHAPATVNRVRKIAMIGDLNLPQCRKYRVEQLEEFWAAQGVDYTFSHVQDVPRSSAILQEATHVMFYRTQNTPLSSMYLYEARRLRLPVLYDLDDPLFSVSAYESYQSLNALPPEMKQHFVSEAPKYLDAMNLADMVTVSTPGMAEHARLYTPREVRIRRNFADRATFEAADAALAGVTQDPEAPFRVAFASGSRGHEADFAVIEEEVTAFLAADPRRQLVILGHYDKTRLPEGFRHQIETHHFTDYAGYLAALATVDCAVMPLTDDQFNRCKSAVRVIDAAAVAVPSIVSPVGDMANVVRDGKTGYVAGPQRDWLESLEALAGDRAAAFRMGQVARADLEKTWSGQAALPIVEQEVLAWVRA